MHIRSNKTNMAIARIKKESEIKKERMSGAAQTAVTTNSNKIRL